LNRKEVLRPSSEAMKIIKQPIAKGEKLKRLFMTFSKYMNAVLYNRLFGFYTSGKADFSYEGADYASMTKVFYPYFGMLIAEHAFRMYKGMVSAGSIKDSEIFHIIDVGAGDGTWICSILEHIEKKANVDKEWQDFWNHVQGMTLEIAPNLKDEQEKTNSKYKEQNKFKAIVCDATRLTESFKPNSIKGLVISYDLLDSICGDKVLISSKEIALALIAPHISSKVLKILGRHSLIDENAFLKVGKALKDLVNAKAIDKDRVCLTGQDFVRIKEKLAESGNPELQGMFDKDISFAELFQTGIIPEKLASHLRKNIDEISLALAKEEIERQANGRTLRIVTYANPGASDYIEGVGRILDKGYVMTFDFGASAHEYLLMLINSIVTTYSGGSKGNDPYTEFWKKAIAVAVNFTFIDRAGKEAGLEQVFYGLQSDLLSTTGINLERVTLKPLYQYHRSAYLEQFSDSTARVLVQRKRGTDLSQYVVANKPSESLYLTESGEGKMTPEILERAKGIKVSLIDKLSNPNMTGNVQTNHLVSNSAVMIPAHSGSGLDLDTIASNTSVSDELTPQELEDESVLQIKNRNALEQLEKFFRTTKWHFDDFCNGGGDAQRLIDLHVVGRPVFG